jgi:hypothetical protein
VTYFLLGGSPTFHHLPILPYYESIRRINPFDESRALTIQSPLNSTTSWGQSLQHRRLWGTLHIQTTTSVEADGLFPRPHLENLKESKLCIIFIILREPRNSFGNNKKKNNNHWLNHLW